MLPDLMPKVGAGKRPGVFYNTGHGHLGWTLAAASLWPLCLGALAITGTAASAYLVAHRDGTAATAGPPGRLADAVANRDFIYLVLLLACSGRAHWFLIPVALGTPIFMMLVRWGAGRRRTA